MDIFVCFICKKHDDSWDGNGMMVYCDHCLEWYHWYVGIYMLSTLYLAFRSCAKVTEEPEATQWFCQTCINRDEQ